nr:hypothetical protein [Grapevine virus E]QYA74514.1 hypothetical protein [Grapevine virus E]
MQVRQLVRSKFDSLTLANKLNRLILEEVALEPELFNPLYFLENEDQRTLLLNQLVWQLSTSPDSEKLCVFRVQQIDRLACVAYDFDSSSIREIFLYSNFSQHNLGELYRFIGCEYLDSCYISELGGKCTLVTQSGNRVSIDVSLDHIVGIIRRLESLCVVITPASPKPINAPYMFHGKSSPYKNAPPLPFG